jgi:DNA polymerase-3 subunit epsilon
VLDFETTGLSPAWGDRPTEIAVTLVSDGRIVDRFQSLMNPRRHIPWQLIQSTGIMNDMVASAPPVEKVMRQAVRFVGRYPIVAHNASFDRKFWDAESDRLALSGAGAFACTMLISRCLYPEAPNHRLGTLVDMLGLPKSMRAHRAMADAEMAAHLWCRIERDLQAGYGVSGVCHNLLTRVQRTPRAQLRHVLGAYK